MAQYFGKYRGKVENNDDPMRLGRVQVSVPSLLGENKHSWAMPCVPYAGSGVGFFAIPPVGANVWVEFEGGDLDYPIWAGCFWGSNEAPAQPPEAKIKAFKSEGVWMIIDDSPGSGGFTLEIGSPIVSSPLKLTCDSSGIELSNGASRIKLTQATVSINDGAMEVS